MIYKPPRYRFNVGLFIIIKRLKAFTLACPPPPQGARLRTEWCSLAKQHSRLPHRTPCRTPRVGPQPGHSHQGLPSKPDCWVRLNQHPWSKEVTRKTLQKQFSYPMTLNPTLDGFKPCLNIYTTFSIAAAAYLDFIANIGSEKVILDYFAPLPRQQRSAIMPVTAAPGAGYIPPRRSHRLTQEVFIAEDGAHRIIKLKHRESSPLQGRFAAHRPWVAGLPAVCCTSRSRGVCASCRTAAASTFPCRAKRRKYRPRPCAVRAFSQPPAFWMLMERGVGLGGERGSSSGLSTES